MCACCNACASPWLKLLECVGLSTGCELGSGEGLRGGTVRTCLGIGLFGGGVFGAGGFGAAGFGFRVCAFFGAIFLGLIFLSLILLGLGVVAA